MTDPSTAGELRRFLEGVADESPITFLARLEDGTLVSSDYVGFGTGQGPADDVDAVILGWEPGDELWPTPTQDPDGVANRRPPKSARDRLVEHGAGTPDRAGTGFSDVVWRAAQSGERPPLDELAADVIGALQQLNERNLHLRSQQRSVAPPELEVSYAMAEVVLGALTNGRTNGVEQADRFSAFAWTIACAWEAFLAGDNPDLAQHVHLERAARQV